MRLSGPFGGVIAFALITLTATLVAINLMVMGRPGGNLWVRYGLLIFATHILVAYLFRWTIPLGSTFAAPNDRSGRVFALIIGLSLYAWSLHSLFFRHGQTL